VLMPVLDENGSVYGYSCRKYDTQEGPKTLSFVDGSKGCWYNGPVNAKAKQIIVVEDQLSALRASHYLNSVALLGTNLTDAALKVLKERQYDNVYLALDPDAFPVSIRMARRLREAGVSVAVLKLPKDIKNMNESELLEWLDKMNVNWYE
jgi:DNA primase